MEVAIAQRMAAENPAPNGTPQSGLQQVEMALAVLDNHVALVASDQSIQQRCEELCRRLCGVTAANSRLDALPADVREGIQQDEEKVVENEQQTTIGRLYALVGSAVVDRDGNLSFVVDRSAAVDAEERRALDDIAEDVRSQRRLPTHRNGSRGVSREYSAEDLRTIRNGVGIFSNGKLLMLEEASFLAKKAAAKLPSD